MKRAIIIEPNDNVVVSIEPIKKGNQVEFSCNGIEDLIISKDDVDIYHKIAIKDIKKGEHIIKYGEHIGLASRDIEEGEHVHVHNVKDSRENLKE